MVKWTNMISRWKKRFVVIDKDTLSYYKKKDRKILGSYCLRGVEIKMSYSDPLGFTLKFKNGELTQFRAPDINERQKWLIAAQAGKIIAEELSEQEEVNAMDGVTLLKSQLVNILRNRILSGSTKLSKNMGSILTLQEQLEDSVDAIVNVLEERKVEIPEVVEHSKTIKTVLGKLKVIPTNNSRAR